MTQTPNSLRDGSNMDAPRWEDTTPIDDAPPAWEDTTAMDDAPSWDDTTPVDAQPDRSFTEEVGIGVDQTQKDLYGLAKRAGEALGSKRITDWSERGIEQQDVDMWQAGHKPGDELSGVAQATRGAAGTVTGLAAAPLLMAGSVPAALAGGGLLATSAGLNLAQNVGENPDKSVGDVALETAFDTVLDAAPIPAIKGGVLATKATGKAAKEAAKKVAVKASPGLQRSPLYKAA